MDERPLPAGRRFARACAGLSLPAFLGLAWLGLLAATPGRAQDASPPAPKSLEEVVALVDQYCGACHRVPPPDVLPKRSWPAAVQTMAEMSREIMGHEFIPVDALPHIKAYYYGSSPAELPRLPYLPPAASPVAFRVSTIGAGSDAPLVTNIAPGLTGAPTDFLVADAGQRQVMRVWHEDGRWKERALADMAVPVHTQVVDLDGDGIQDILVAELGELPPSGKKVGKVVVLRGQASGEFVRHTLVEGLGRVTDVRAVDLDGDGDLDVAVAVFGGQNQGEILWLENRDGSYHPHTLVSLAGALGVEPVDLDGDGRLDLVSLVAQEHEMVLAFRNLGGGRFEQEVIARAPHPMFGSTFMLPVDLDQDGDIDLVFTNGDAFDLQTEPKPYHGVQWLENLGGMEFRFHDIGRLYGAATAAVGDLDGDGDLDIVVSSWVNYWNDPGRHTLVWYENDGRQGFTAHPIASRPAGLVSLRLADVNGDGRTDIVAAAFRMDLLLERMGFPFNPDTRPKMPEDGGQDSPRLLLFENLPASGGAGTR
ncbi:hypothetical protein B1992_09745 [Pseudoxanthomonas broegbernensis]|uniref:VCBS repeat-containing protein n=1 Tax=Pseudoxanthomonas broegbernensis TaxID=83619 RepID=A0A7V8GLT0_9GAMM|nr:VCBS repeat-containing protein [Pseudoxanthomonas broegbernensis]KAF1685979.1 hypothetical protein B1992_09745 [Pseudoxanthomonas broegbernensis]MBB6063767.1 hypothetical protein [Pseudoxanthomonas broegbernensis]